MPLLCTPQSLLRQRISHIPRIPSSSRRAIHDLHIVQPDSPDGLTGLWGYRRIPFPKLANQKICLWRGSKKLGVMGMPKVMSEYLGPGKLLSWRPSDDVSDGPDSRSGREAGYSKGEPSIKPAKDALDYEIINISFPAPAKKFFNSLRNRREGMHNVVLRCNHPPSALSERTMLAGAYHLLGDPILSAICPVRFNIRFNIRLPPEAPDRYRIRWAVRNRVDLHPEVIMRAMPEGVRCTTSPRIRVDGWNLVWSCVARDYGALARRRANSAQHLRGAEEKKAKEARSRPKLSGEMANGAELQEKFERALGKAQRKQTAVIRETHEKRLRKAVKIRLDKYPDSPRAPLPEEKAKMKESMKAVIDQAMLKVRASIEYDFGIRQAPTAAVEDDAVDQASPISKSPMKDDRSS